MTQSEALDGPKRVFYLGLAALAALELLRVYLIMPMPGSQRLRSLDLAYFLHVNRWAVRAACVLAVAVGTRAAARRSQRWRVVFASCATLAALWLINFKLSADQMFKQPAALVFQPRARNTIDEGSLIIGVEHNGDARAYPVRFLTYHHQVQDTVGGEPVLVTYCSVCRTARVFEPLVGGRREKFRLVGMDRFNALLEDATTGSWWRQATGRAVTGDRKGMQLAEVAYRQVTLRTWFEMHASAVVMQQDDGAKDDIDPEGKYERGQSTGELTRTDPASWQDKSWVLGVDFGFASKAYDWNRLKRERVINDEFAGKAIVLALALDGRSYAGFERPAKAQLFTIKGDVISEGSTLYDFDGRNLAAPEERLKALSAHQEFWHSWRTFHPDTLRDH